ncbi:hypothetical protein [Ruminococcus champanellensis]
MAEPTTQAQEPTESTIKEPAGANTGGGDPTSAPGAAQEPAAKPDAPTPEELAAFRKWQESQRSDAEKQAAAISKAEKARLAAEAKAAAAELKLSALSKGVAAEALDDVIALARTKISDSVTAEQAIESIVQKYPQFGAGVTTGVHTGSGGTDNLSGVEAAFYAKNPDLKIK